MKYFQLASLSGVIIALLLTTTAQDQKRDLAIPGQPAEGFQVSAVAENTSVSHGGRVNLKIATKNVSKQMLYLAFADPEKIYQIQIFRDIGESVPLTRHGKDLEKNTELYMNGSMRLLPGDERTDTLSVSDIYDMTAPGIYAIIVTRKVGKLKGRGVAEVASNMVHVQVN